MAKPTEWIVYFGADSQSFTCRARARGFAMIRRAAGDVVRIESRGF